MTSHVNPSISVDCVVFGFDGVNLRVLLIDFIRIKREAGSTKEEPQQKLPGMLILDEEDLDTAANRALKQYADLDSIYLKQFGVFSDPTRITNPDDLLWIENEYGVKTSRIVTVAYFALVKLNNNMLKPHVEGEVDWYKIDEVRTLAFDHKSILMKALNTLTAQLLSEPIAFELLQKRFTIRQLQNVYEAILGIEIDNRNFRKKVLKMPFIKPLEEKEKQVAHKPALLYKFDRHAYDKLARKYKPQLNFIRFI
jgi:8-oxo-dGTP diphosphatase